MTKKNETVVKIAQTSSAGCALFCIISIFAV